MIRYLGGVLVCFCAALGFASTTEDGDWPAHRGGPARTGNVDGKPGPAQPKVLWVLRSKDQFLAPMSVGAGKLFVTVMGPFNSGAIRALEPAEAKPPIWTKTAPAI